MITGFDGLVDSWLTRFGAVIGLLGLWAAFPAQIWLAGIAAVLAVVFLLSLVWQGSDGAAVMARLNRDDQIVRTALAQTPTADVTFCDIAYALPDIRETNLHASPVERDMAFATRLGLVWPNVADAVNLARSQAVQNEIHLFVDPIPSRLDESIQGTRADYKLARTLEKAQPGAGRFWQLSGNAVVTSDHGTHVLIQYRSEYHDTFPGCWNILGGSFDPDHDHGNIAITAEREVREETSGVISIETRGSAIILQREDLTHYAAICFLGATTVKSVIPTGNKEGDCQWVALTDLPYVLSRPNWVPTGRQAMIAWLALGAPLQGQTNPIRRRKARRILAATHRAVDKAARSHN